MQRFPSVIFRSSCSWRIRPVQVNAIMESVLLGHQGLLTLSTVHVHGIRITIPQFNGQKQMALKVMITSDPSPVGRYALSSILF